MLRRLIRIIGGSVAVLLLLGFAWAMTINCVPRNLGTGTRMYELRTGILRYAHTHNRLPDSLAALEFPSGANRDCNDAWGYPIQYNIEKDGTVVLKSPGKDGGVLGIGDHGHYTYQFPSRNKAGQWDDGSAIAITETGGGSFAGR